MRKIYSIVLMACAMLISASAFADVTTRQQIQDAITGASEGQTVNILLKNNIDVDATITINAGQIVNVDLNGHNMKADGAGVFILRKGTLNIIGTGTIEKTGRTETDAIRVYGSDDPTVANYSNLTIGENVTMNVHGPKKKDTTDGLEEDGYMVETTNAITVMEQGTSPATLKAAYGVNIEIKGKVYGSKYGVKINGNVTGNVYSTDPENKYDNRPYVHVASTAEVYCNPSTNNATAIYSSGVGRFLIEGYVHGASAVFVKSGTVELNDAVVKSDYVGTFNDDHKKKGSGINARGSAITIQSQSNYAGGQAVTIKGDTKVEAGSGYAIEETIKSGTTKVNSIVIEGGTIETGANGKGAIIFTEATKNAAEQETANIEIIGGNIENYVQIKEEGGNVVATTVDQFLPKTETDHYKTTAVTDEAGKTTIVVTYFENTADKPVVANSVVAAADETGIDWTVTADTEETLTDSKILTYLEAVSAANKQTLNVGDATHNVTLKVGRIVLGPKAKIVVAAGSRLIVDGKQGIVAPVTSNIVLETSESNPAIFLFNPAVTSNRHPNATVSLIANSYTNPDDKENDYLYQRFGVPTHNAIKKVTAKKGGEDVQMFVRKYEKNGWTNVGYLNVSGKSLNLSQLNDPFGYYVLQCNTAEVGTLVNMEGELVGNDNATLRMGQNTNGWSTFANSYSADLDMTAMLDMFKGMPSGTNIAVYYQKNETGTDNQLGWDTWNFTTMLFKTALTLHPMQAFLMQDPAGAAAESLALNYKNMVYDPAMADAEAPAPRRAMSNLTMASVKVMNNGDAVYMIQGDEFSSEMESGYDSEKYMSGNANIYVMSDKKYATCATDNLENTYLGFSCAEAGNYTISFEHIAGEGLALVDMVANKVINMTEGATYEFYAQESNDYRFKVVGRNNVATDVETVENAVKAAGVYTLTGMYLGNMSVWNTLPAGVYVVDGEKRVK